MLDAALRPLFSLGIEPTGMPAAAKRDLFPGALELMVLRSLELEPLHGYALATRIQQRSRDLLQVEEGSLYPALQRLLKAGLVDANGRPRRPTAASAPIRSPRKAASISRARPPHSTRWSKASSSCSTPNRGIMMHWLRNLLFRKHAHDDLAEEMREHMAERTAALIEQGRDPEEAAREARRAFGNITLARERSVEVWQWRWLENLWADLRFALHQLRKSPGYTLTAILTLAIGIGANAAIFTLIDDIMLRSLPVSHPEQLVEIGLRSPSSPYFMSGQSIHGLRSFGSTRAASKTSPDGPAIWSSLPTSRARCDPLLVHWPRAMRFPSWVCAHISAGLLPPQTTCPEAPTAAGLWCLITGSGSPTIMAILAFLAATS